MTISSRISNRAFPKLILFTILALSSKFHPTSSQENEVAYNDTRQSFTNQTQASSCELAPANKQHTSILKSNDDAKFITDRDGDLENSAATSSIVQMAPAQKQANLNQDLVTSPSVTSIHQVWTSSSSGSLGELSPEMISKLRNDVPFLAAYALRPRLVGASTQGDSNNNNNNEYGIKSSISDINKLGANKQPVETYVGQLQPPQAKAEKTSLQAQASSPQATKSLIPKLGDFSEFNVETLSSSKSEHHHKRKTTLKRKPNDNGQLSLTKRTLTNAIGHQSIKGGIGQLNKSNRLIGKNNKQQSRANKIVRKKSKSLSRSRGKSRSKAIGSKLRQHMNIIKHGRYYQKQSIDPSDSDNSTEMVLDSRAVGDQTTMIVEGTKNSNEGGVKGGSSGSRKTPFYSKVKPTVDVDEPASGDDKSVNDTDNPDDGSDLNSLDRTRPPKDGNESSNEPEEGELEEPLEPLEPPRRVGDEDVEEDGDTVTVMPKSDGVDDDPEIPIGSPEEDQNGPTDDSQGGTREREDDNKVPENDPRGRRVDRERPNSSDTNDNEGGRDITVGGGIGATTGGGAGSSGGVGDGPTEGNKNPSSSGGSKNDEDGEDGLNPNSDSDQGRFGNRGSSMGRNDEAQNDNDRTKIGDQEEEARDRSEAGRESNSNDDRDSDRFDGSSKKVDSDSKSSSSAESDNFDARRSKSDGRDDSQKNNNNGVGGNAKPLCPGDGSPCLDGGHNEGGDIDYRDEMVEAALGRKNGKNETEVGMSNDEQGVKRKKEKKKHGDADEEDRDCDDHHSDGHYDHHHDHHNSIKWLQDAIPGEPGQDYPILSRINLSNFNCRDQKYPGYYADVKSRCQVFHICQADGRQDSFLCPNGTIFSQISTVCVWWNSFDCEDAPKYYERNSLLYKASKSSSNANSPIDDLKPLDGARINPKDMTLTSALDEEDDSSPIDGLIRAMRRKEDSATDSGVSYSGPRNKEGMMDTMIRGIAEDDEASIQRKSTNIEADSSLSSGTSSQLRRNKGHESRRKRRASIRQAPPKLKSRRVSRNSKRRKLRHGIKPKRRA